MFRNGISISINTDGRTISDTTLNKEYNLLNKNFNWLKNKFLEVNLNAMKASFSSKEIKEKIRFALSVKPKRHDFIINSETKPYINRHMNETGG